MRINVQNVVDYARTATAVIPRNGDLLAKLWLVIELAALAVDGAGRTGRFVDDVGRAIVEEISFEAGSVLYDRLRPEFMHVWEELSILQENQLGRLTGKSESTVDLALWATAAQRLYVPLEFWFQREYGAALPLVALHLTDVKINVRLKTKAQVVATDPNSPVAGTYDSTTAVSTSGAITDMFVCGEFIYLDDPERDFFARSEHKYLITQNQYLQQTIASGSTSAAIDVHFNHPCKEFIMFNRTSTNTTAQDWFNFAGQETGKYAEHAFKTLALTLNGNDRIKARDPLYFRSLQCQQHHTRIPSKHIYVYSLALSPEQPGPTGSLNLSRIENTQFQLVFTAALGVATDYFISVRNFNVVTVAGGVGSIKWAS
jgi:hypothetical protein